MKVFKQSPLLDLFGLQYPLIQAPMAGANDARMVIEVSDAGAMGSLPCAMLDVAGARTQLEQIRSATNRPFNVNFFCHEEQPVTAEQEALWRGELAPYYREAGLDAEQPLKVASRKPFSAAICLLYTSPSPRDGLLSRMPSSA